MELKDFKLGCRCEGSSGSIVEFCGKRKDRDVVILKPIEGCKDMILYKNNNESYNGVDKNKCFGISRTVFLLTYSPLKTK